MVLDYTVQKAHLCYFVYINYLFHENLYEYRTIFYFYPFILLRKLNVTSSFDFTIFQIFVNFCH